MTEVLQYVRWRPGVDSTDINHRVDDWFEREGVGRGKLFEDRGAHASPDSPLERPGFLAACEHGKATGAEGILMPSIDHFAPPGNLLLSWAAVEMARRYDLVPHLAIIPRRDLLEDPHQALTRLQIDPQWVNIGIKQPDGSKRRPGLRKHYRGRRPALFNDREMTFITELRRAGFGWRYVAQRLNEFHRPHDPVSYSTLRRAFQEESYESA